MIQQSSKLEFGNIVLLAQSDNWRCVFQQLDFPGKIVHALNWSDLLQEAEANLGCIAAIEIPVANAGKTCRMAARHSNNRFQMRMIALGSPQSVHWSPLVQLSGFAEAYWSTIESKRILDFANRHFQTVRWPERTLEEQIESALPWPPRTKK